MFNHNFDYFITIVAEKNISTAARKLYVSQPLLSRYLKSLECDVGCELFDRKKAPLKLTAAGELYLKYIMDLQARERRFRNELQELGQAVRGKVKLGVSAWRGSFLIPEILPSFWKIYPNISVEVSEGSQNQLAHILNEESIDFCIMHIPNAYSNIKSEPVVSEEIYLAVNNAHPILQIAGTLKTQYGKRFGSISLAELAYLDFIMLNEDQNLRIFIYSYLNRHGINPNVLFRTNNVNTALALVDKGTGVTFVPGQGVRFGSYSHQNIVYLSVNEDPIRWDICLSWKVNADLSPQSKLLMSHIRKILQPLVP